MDEIKTPRRSVLKSLLAMPLLAIFGFSLPRAPKREPLKTWDTLGAVSNEQEVPFGDFGIALTRGEPGGHVLVMLENCDIVGLTVWQSGSIAVGDRIGTTSCGVACAVDALRPAGQSKRSPVL